MIGIIGAMEEEVAQLQKEMEAVEIREIASMKFFKGRLENQEVVVVQSGIGKVNASICATLLIQEYKIEALIHTGIAGGLKEGIRIGDMVVSTDSVHHDMDATAFGEEAGQVPRMKVLAFPADEKLGRLAFTSNEKANPEIQTFMGRIATGDKFVSSQEDKAFLLHQFQADCVEMEGAGVGQVAYLFQVPYVIVRAISDQADSNASVDFPTFEKQAILHSVNLVKEMLRKWSTLA